MPWKRRRRIALWRRARLELARPLVRLSAGIISASVAGVLAASALQPSPPGTPSVERTDGGANTSLPALDAEVRVKFAPSYQVLMGARHVSSAGDVCGWVRDPNGGWHRYLSFRGLTLVDAEASAGLFERRWSEIC